jgi:hypothetical protein
MLNPIQYEFIFFKTTLADPEPGAGAETSIFRLRLQPKVPAPCVSGSGATTLLIRLTRNQKVEPKLHSGSGQKFWLLAFPATQHWLSISSKQQLLTEKLITRMYAIEQNHILYTILCMIFLFL